MEPLISGLPRSGTVTLSSLEAFAQLAMNEEGVKLVTKHLASQTHCRKESGKGYCQRRNVGILATKPSHPRPLGQSALLFLRPVAQSPKVPAIYTNIYFGRCLLTLSQLHANIISATIPPNLQAVVGFFTPTNRKGFYFYVRRQPGQSEGRASC